MVGFENKGSEQFGDSFSVCVWDGVKDGQEGEAVQAVGDIVIQVDGDFDGGSVEIKASLDGVEYHDMLSFYEPGIQALSNMVRHIKPVVTAGSNASVKVTLLLKKG